MGLSAANATFLLRVDSGVLCAETLLLPEDRGDGGTDFGLRGVDDRGVMGRGGVDFRDCGDSSNRTVFLGRVVDAARVDGPLGGVVAGDLRVERGWEVARFPGDFPVRRSIKDMRTFCTDL